MVDLTDLEPVPAGQFHVRGGVGGISFQLQELLDGARRLDRLAAELREVEIRLQGALGSLFSYQLDTPVTGSAAVTAVREALSELTAVRSGLEKSSAGVRAAYRDYEYNEAVLAGQRLLGPFSPVPRLSRDAGDVLPGLWPPTLEATELLVGSAPVSFGLLFLLGLPRQEVVPILAAHHAAGRSPSDVRSLVRLVAETSGGRLQPRKVTASAGASEKIMLDATPDGLLERARQLENERTASVEIIRVERAGPPAYVVIVPGTRGGEAGRGDPFDTVGIIEGLGYHSSETAAAIRDGLHAAGATRGSEVVAVGYSQGGIHAMNLARNREFLDDFELKYVLTAGSPVGAVQASSGTSSLHLEHRQDWVPGSDGMPGPDARNRVTVTLTGQVKTPEGAGFGLGPGHSLHNYREGAAGLRSSTDPSVVESLGVLGGVVGAGGLATATKVGMTRIPGPARQPPVPSPGPFSPRSVPGRVR